MIPLTSLRHLARRIFLVAALVVGLFALTAGVKVGAAAGSSTYDTADFAYDGPVDVAQRLMVAAADVVVPIDWVDNAVFPAPQTDGHLHDSSTDLVAPSRIPGVADDIADQIDGVVARVDDGLPPPTGVKGGRSWRSNYSPAVIQQFPDRFSDYYFDYWGISR